MNEHPQEGAAEPGPARARPEGAAGGPADESVPREIRGLMCDDEGWSLDWPEDP